MYGAWLQTSASISRLPAAPPANALSLAAAGVAQRVHHEEPVLGGDVAEPEHRGAARRRIDVRDAEGRVARDRQPLAVAGAVDARLVAGRNPEARVLEERADRLRAHAGRGAQQPLVHPELVVVVARARPGREEVRELEQAHAAVGAGRQDVLEAEVVAFAVRTHIGRGGRGERAARGGCGQANGDATTRHEDLPVEPETKPTARRRAAPRMRARSRCRARAGCRWPRRATRRPRRGPRSGRGRAARPAGRRRRRGRPRA